MTRQWADLRPTEAQKERCDRRAQGHARARAASLPASRRRARRAALGVADALPVEGSSPPARGALRKTGPCCLMGGGAAPLGGLQ